MARTIYKNISRISSVLEFEIFTTSITIKFINIHQVGNLKYNCYNYSYSSAGSNNVETMKSLARNGRGLNSFLNKNFRWTGYSNRWFENY